MKLKKVDIGEAVLYCGDSLDVAKQLPDNSVDLIATDPPYFKVKNEDWDRQWDKPEAFLLWLKEHLTEWQRILKPNGSLYVFASPQMAARVEIATSERFNVLNNIAWYKGATINDHSASSAHRCEKVKLRAFFPETEKVIFAEHYGADNIAKGEAGYQAKCDELRGFVFEPLRAYLDEQRDHCGMTPEDCNDACGHRRQGGMAGRHYFSVSQFCLPTAENYEKLRHAATARGFDCFTREYEDLRREYEDLRRPFSVTAEVPYTDVWTFKTVQAYQGKHPCEKPLAMMEHIVRTSSKDGAVVFDPFMGSGTTGEAAINLGRQFIGADKSGKWFDFSVARLDKKQKPLFA